MSARACVECGATVSKSATRCHRCANRRSPPADFDAFAAVNYNSECLKHWVCGPKTLARWRRERGIKAPPAPPHGRAQAKIPDGFATLAPTLTLTEIRRHYGIGEQTARRFCKELGIKPHRLTGDRVRTVTIHHTRRDDSRPGQAANFLCHWGPVYRCRETGRADLSGTFWNRGGHVLTDAEIIARAERLGWNPDAWRQAA